MKKKIESQSQIVSSDSLKHVHNVTYDNFYSKQGVEAFEKALKELKKKESDRLENAKVQIYTRSMNFTIKF